MENEIFELEEERLKEEIIKRGARKILIQLPEGLKKEGPRLAALVEEAGALAIVSADPCYGACDLALPEAEKLAADLIVHYGHTELTGSERVPIIYMEARAGVDIKTAVEKALDYLKPWRKIGLATTVQHIHMLEEARRILNNAGKTVYIGDAGRTKYPGQVIGCDYSNAKSILGEAEAFLFIGGGRFHALGLALATMKPTVVADPFEGRAYSVDEDAQRIIKRRWTDICEAEKAHIFGILIGLKSGQSHIESALKIKQDLENKERKAVLLALREITPEVLLQFPTLEAYVNTACPRISIDEPSGFTKPVLTVKETYVMLGETRWEDLLREGLI